MSESETITIRPRAPSDAPVLIQILANVHNLTGYPVDGPTSFPARFQSSKAFTSLVALYKGDLAGHVELQDPSALPSTVVKSLASHAPMSSFAALVSLFVDPKIQGKGIGARLIDEALTWGRVEGKRLVLVVLDKDTAAIRMYEKLGWERGVEYIHENFEGISYRAFSYLSPV
ncbi:acyl-CoA N-acyltransferase [Clathrospora elynae]|uniref:Acyl-CoA N-acyltransferase n=1 Tax=Clathrospora elynae TaxID=706981 RepID=A0A6A5SRT4_9PLEO|nr:acyl-CoA N-acyltransferase [Clathrospora elynae]